MTNVPDDILMVRKDVALPTSLCLETEDYSSQWLVVPHLFSYKLSSMLHNAGWRLFFIAGNYETTVIGSGRGSVRRGLNRLLHSLRGLDFNCMELAGVSRRRFFGLPYSVLSAHLYHIQAEGRPDLGGDRRRHENEMFWNRR
jgi:hypothetical protein